MKSKKYMPTLGLEPNTCFLHEYQHSTLPHGLVVNTSTFVLLSNTWAVFSEQSLTLIHILLKISREIGVFA
jgi:hypothetical protein